MESEKEELIKKYADENIIDFVNEYLEKNNINYTDEIRIEINYIGSEM